MSAELPTTDEPPAWAASAIKRAEEILRSDLGPIGDFCARWSDEHATWWLRREVNYLERDNGEVVEQIVSRVVLEANTNEAIVMLDWGFRQWRVCGVQYPHPGMARR